MARSSVYLIPTPIGDRFSDLAVASLHQLERLEHLFVEAEDGFVARARDRGVITPRHRLHPMDDPAAAVTAAVELVRRGTSFAILASSGLPGFVDPGHQIVGRLLRDHLDEVTFVPLGMSSALDAMLAMTGVDVQKFVFAGHVPENYLLTPALLALELPVLLFVRGPALRPLLDELRALPATHHRVVLLKDVRKRGRFRVYAWDAPRWPSVDAPDESHDADYALALLPDRSPQR